MRTKQISQCTLMLLALFPLMPSALGDWSSASIWDQAAVKAYQKEGKITSLQADAPANGLLVKIIDSQSQTHTFTLCDLGSVSSNLKRQLLLQAISMDLSVRLANKSPFDNCLFQVELVRLSTVNLSKTGIN